MSANRNTDGGTLYRTTQLSTEFIANDSFTYYYDELGNITTVKKGERKSTDSTSADFKAVANAGDYRSYTYDNLSQLTREDNKTTGLTNLWTYDRLGNIQTKTEYNYTEETSITANRNLYVDYQYGDDDNTSFNKLLKNIDVYNGTSDIKSTRYAITYDEIGNPTKYEKISYDNKGVQVGDTVTAASLNWRGRQLMKLTDSVNSNTISYLYDADGLRGSKTVNGAKTTYTYVGDKLCYQHTANADGTTNYELYFFYDCKGALSVLQYYIHSGTTVNGYTYYVASNAFGDVTGLYGADGVLRVAYEYDAWGNVISVTDADENKITNPNSIAHRNPIRYRGYYYDTETGFYYLQSRYYCPKIGRFLNADNLMSDVGGVILGCNVFAYCQNNPINKYDPTGHWSKRAERIGFGISCALVAVSVVAAVAAIVVSAPASIVCLTAAAVSVSVCGIVSGISNSSKGGSYINGCVGGYVSGVCEEVGSAVDVTNTGVGDYLGGVIGCGLGNATTMVLNNIDPSSPDVSMNEIVSSSLRSAKIGLFTKMGASVIGAGVDLANGSGTLMPGYTQGFGIGLKTFFDVLDDAMAYILE